MMCLNLKSLQSKLFNVKEPMLLLLEFKKCPNSYNQILNPSNKCQRMKLLAKMMIRMMILWMTLLKMKIKLTTKNKKKKKKLQQFWQNKKQHNRQL